MGEWSVPRTLTQLKSRVAQAMAEADDVEAVLELIREAVRTHGFDVEDIFGRQVLRPTLGLMPRAPTQSSPVPRRTRRTIPQAPFADSNGNTWSGRGRHPNWLVAELAKGASVEQFSTASQRKASPAGQKKKKKEAQRHVDLPPYGDAEGNTWSGRGRRPNWLNAALGRGASLEDFSSDGR